MPLGITSNAYDTFYYPDTPSHNKWVEKCKAFSGEKYPSSWMGTGYDAMKFLVEAINKAGTTDTENGHQGIRGLNHRLVRWQADHARQGSSGHPRTILGYGDKSCRISVSDPKAG